jgi:hypothetical protein
MEDKFPPHGKKKRRRGEERYPPILVLPSSMNRETPPSTDTRPNNRLGRRLGVTRTLYSSFALLLTAKKPHATHERSPGWLCGMIGRLGSQSHVMYISCSFEFFEIDG